MPLPYVDPNQNNPAISALYQGINLPNQIGALGTQLDPLTWATISGQFGLDQQLAQQNYGNTLAQLGIQGGALGREQQYLPQQQALASQLLGLQGSDLGIQRQRLGLQGQGLDIQGKQLGLQGQGLDITEAQERAANLQAQQGAWSNAAASGATNTSGFRTNLGNINQNLAFQLQQLGLSRQGLGLQGQELDLSRQGLGLSGQELDLSGQRLGIEQQQQNIGNILQSGSLQDQLAQLGLSRTEAGQALQNSLTQGSLGLLGQVGTAYNNQVNQAAALAAGGAQSAGQAGGMGSYSQPTYNQIYNAGVPAGGSRLQ